jgi:hypothetical protein
MAKDFPTVIQAAALLTELIFSGWRSKSGV